MLWQGKNRISRENSGLEQVLSVSFYLVSKLFKLNPGTPGGNMMSTSGVMSRWGSKYWNFLEIVITGEFPILKLV